ncbi:hypothetical protein PoB_006730800 [Plakobranchus ocellatus]|uniref:Uncharacterized protein n=1 Tax=Plakobranchus ocellatus TaxID=259542 RepID=A0AAV4D9F2_9GAST|nr:hypothetical protein PoB_006730800 [Plakobranchus ocellatus]
MDEEEFVAVWHQNIPPTVRQPFDIEELDSNGDGNNREGHREGIVILYNLPFFGRTGLLVDVEATHLLTTLALWSTTA